MMKGYHSSGTKVSFSLSFRAMEMDAEVQEAVAADGVVPRLRFLGDLCLRGVPGVREEEGVGLTGRTRAIRARRS